MVYTVKANDRNGGLFFAVGESEVNGADRSVPRTVIGGDHECDLIAFGNSDGFGGNYGIIVIPVVVAVFGCGDVIDNVAPAGFGIDGESKFTGEGGNILIIYALRIFFGNVCGVITEFGDNDGIIHSVADGGSTDNGNNVNCFFAVVIENDFVLACSERSLEGSVHEVGPVGFAVNGNGNCPVICDSENELFIAFDSSFYAANGNVYGVVAFNEVDCRRSFVAEFNFGESHEFPNNLFFEGACGEVYGNLNELSVNGLIELDGCDRGCLGCFFDNEAVICNSSFFPNDTVGAGGDLNVGCGIANHAHIFAVETELNEVNLGSFAIVEYKVDFGVLACIGASEVLHEIYVCIGESFCAFAPFTVCKTCFGCSEISVSFNVFAVNEVEAFFILGSERSELNFGEAHEFPNNLFFEGAFGIAYNNLEVLSGCGFGKGHGGDNGALVAFGDFIAKAEVFNVFPFNAVVTRIEEHAVCGISDHAVIFAIETELNGIDSGCFGITEDEVDFGVLPHIGANEVLHEIYVCIGESFCAFAPFTVCKTCFGCSEISVSFNVVADFDSETFFVCGSIGSSFGAVCFDFIEEEEIAAVKNELDVLCVNSSISGDGIFGKGYVVAPTVFCCGFSLVCSADKVNPGFAVHGNLCGYGVGSCNAHAGLGKRINRDAGNGINLIESKVYFKS